MSLYASKIKIGGVPCGMVLRGPSNGQYQAVFERELAALEEIEAICWDRPEIEGDCVLPTGYGFDVRDVRYSAATRCYTVELETAGQYLGDVTGYQAEIGTLEETVQAQQQAIQEKEEAAQIQAAALKEKEELIRQQNEAAAKQAEELRLKEEAILAQQQTIEALEQGAASAAVMLADMSAAYEEGVEGNG